MRTPDGERLVVGDLGHVDVTEALTGRAFGVSRDARLVLADRPKRCAHPGPPRAARNHRAAGTGPAVGASPALRVPDRRAVVNRIIAVFAEAYRHRDDPALATWAHTATGLAYRHFSGLRFVRAPPSFDMVSPETVLRGPILRTAPRHPGTIP